MAHQERSRRPPGGRIAPAQAGCAGRLPVA